MKNLLERLKPEHKAKLEARKMQYPSISEDVYSNLIKHHFFTELTVGASATLCSLLDLDLSEIVNLFDEK